MVESRIVHVVPERLPDWLAGFSGRHGAPTCAASESAVSLHAPDGAVADCQVPFAPLRTDPDAEYAGLVDHVRRDRRVGVVLVRRGGYAAGVFDGRTLLTSKVGSRHVQGRTAAGGWSQRRFARRREQQARAAFGAAADVAVRILLPYAAGLDAVVGGGDRRACAQVLDDPRLARLLALVDPRHLDVPDPKLAVLRQTPRQFRAVRIELTEPVTGSADDEPDEERIDAEGTDAANG